MRSSRQFILLVDVSLPSGPNRSRQYSEHVASVGPVRGTGPDFEYAETPHLLYDTHWHPFIQRTIREAGERFGVPLAPVVMYEWLADLYPFASVGPRGVPSIMLLQPSFWYHTAQDTTDKIPPHDLEQVARLHAHLVDVLDEMPVAKIREGWRDDKEGEMPSHLNVLGLDLKALRAVELLQ